MKRIKGTIAFLLSILFVIQSFQPVLAAADQKPEEEQCLGEEEILYEDGQVKTEVIHVNLPSADENGIQNPDESSDDADPLDESLSGELANTSETHSVLLMLDISDSMNGTPASELKKAAKSFVKEILAEDPNAGIALVTFGGSVKEYDFGGKYFTNVRDSLFSTIDNLTTGGGTPMDSALQKSDEILSKYSNADVKYIIQMTDGVPENKTNVINYYNAIKSTTDYRIISMGFFHSIASYNEQTCRTFLMSIQNSGYIEVKNASDLTFSFSQVSGIISQKPVVLSKQLMTLYPGIYEKLTLRFTKAYEETDKTITWSSSNPSIATVDSQGRVLSF